MKAHTQLYHNPQPTKSFSVIEICMLVDSGQIITKSLPERKRMRLILKNNMEAQKLYGQNALYNNKKQAHFELATKLEKYRKLISEKP